MVEASHVLQPTTIAMQLWSTLLGCLEKTSNIIAHPATRLLITNLDGLLQDVRTDPTYCEKTDTYYPVDAHGKTRVIPVDKVLKPFVQMHNRFLTCFADEVLLPDLPAKHFYLIAPFGSIPLGYPTLDSDFDFILGIVRNNEINDPYSYTSTREEIELRHTVWQHLNSLSENIRQLAINCIQSQRLPIQNPHTIPIDMLVLNMCSISELVCNEIVFVDGVSVCLF